MTGCSRAAAMSLLSLMVLMSSSSLEADTLVTTKEGREFAGDVIDAGVNTLTMKLAGSGYQIVPAKSIDRIKVDIADGSPIEGKLIDWSEGELIIRVGDRDVGVRDGVITSVIDVGVAAGGPEVAPSTAPANVEVPAADEPSTPASAPTNATM